MENKRIQISLYFDEEESQELENIRKTYNLVQYHLIPAHITLCREEELKEIESLKNDLNNFKFEPFTIHLEKPKRVAEGKGVLLPVQENSNFLELRKLFIKDLNIGKDFFEPHITLMHARNSECTDPIFKEIIKKDLPKKLNVISIHLIEQINGGKWKIL